MLGRYKEIWYGIVIGISMWALDAMMHASMHSELGWSEFRQEFIASNSTQLFFRSLFVIVSMGFGFSLWLSNQRKCQVLDLQDAINSLHSQIVNPALLISGYCRMLSFKEGWPVSREEVEMIREIQLNAQKITVVINQLPPPGTPLPQVELSSIVDA